LFPEQFSDLVLTLAQINSRFRRVVSATAHGRVRRFLSQVAHRSDNKQRTLDSQITIISRLARQSHI
jgi:hypothetical protein